jgi:hypothetical protein
MEEEFEENLCFHRLGLFRGLGIILKTTNRFESLHSQLGSKTDKVVYWKNLNPQHLYVAATLLEMGTGLRCIKEYRFLTALQTVLQAVLNLTENRAWKTA